MQPSVDNLPGLQPRAGGGEGGGGGGGGEEKRKKTLKNNKQKESKEERVGAQMSDIHRESEAQPKFRRSCSGRIFSSTVGFFLII